jgi:hypothetical protein
MPLRSTVVLTAVLYLCFAAAAPAQPGPSDAPATEPARGPATLDSTTPRGTLKMLSDAMEQGEVETIRSLMIAIDDTERKMIDAQADQALAFATFRDALVATFGAQAFGELTGNQVPREERLALFDAAEATVDGDTAVVVVGRDSYVLKQVDGKWLLSLTAMARSLDLAMLEESLQQMSVRSEVMQEVATEIAEGKYQNIDEVGQALQGKMMVAMMRQAAATQPAER